MCIETEVQIDKFTAHILFMYNDHPEIHDLKVLYTSTLTLQSLVVSICPSYPNNQ
jgi:hypothetical protein